MNLDENKHFELIDKLSHLFNGHSPDQAICALIGMLVHVWVARGYDKKEFIQCVAESLSDSYEAIQAQKGEALH